MSVKIRACSWDVGIKNLAYCIMEWDVERKEFEIVKWDIINISTEESFECIGIMKSGKKCGKKAIWKIQTQATPQMAYCGSHKSCYALDDISFEDVFSKIDRDIMKDNKRNSVGKCSYNVECNTNSSLIHKTDGYIMCSAHGKSKFNKLKKTLELKSVSKGKSYKQELMGLAEKMMGELDAIPELIRVDEVYIENQPTMINPTMKTISAFLYNYFIIRGRIDSKNIHSIRFISPSNKLRVNEDRTMEVLTKAKTDGKTYKMTKELGIKYTKILLKDGTNDRWAEYLDTYKKKDDLCDSFLQGYYSLSKRS